MRNCEKNIKVYIKEMDGLAVTIFTCLRIETVGGLWFTWLCTFGLNEIWEIAWVAKKVLAFKALRHMEFVILFLI